MRDAMLPAMPAALLPMPPSCRRALRHLMRAPFFFTPADAACFMPRAAAYECRAFRCRRCRQRYAVHFFFFFTLHAAQDALAMPIVLFSVIFSSPLRHCRAALSVAKRARAPCGSAKIRRVFRLPLFRRLRFSAQIDIISFRRRRGSSGSAAL